MSKQFIWRPKEFKTPPVDGVDIAFPVGIGPDMYYCTGQDEDGNPIFDQVGTIAFPDPSNKKIYEVTYYPQYDGPRENESQESKDAKEQYDREVQQRANEESVSQDAENGSGDNGSDADVSDTGAGTEESQRTDADQTGLLSKE